MSVHGSSGYRFQYTVNGVRGTLKVSADNVDVMTFEIKLPAVGRAGMADGSPEQFVSLTIDSEDYNQLVALIATARQRFAQLDTR